MAVLYDMCVSKALDGRFVSVVQLYCPRPSVGVSFMPRMTLCVSLDCEIVPCASTYSSSPPRLFLYVIATTLEGQFGVVCRVWWHGY